MKTAFLFPGQGSQIVGMGKDICEKYPEANEIFEKASKILGQDIKELCFETSIEELSQTKNTQIALAVTSLAILEVLKSKGIEADIVTGLSLGEYVALIYAGYLTLEDGLLLLQKRGYYMQNYVEEGNYAMAAVIGMDSKKIEEVTKKIRENGDFVVPANYNYSGQTVISGEAKAVEKASSELKELGAKRVIPLKTSGPFHTIKLEKAKELFEKELEKVEFKKLENNIKVIKNLDGTYYQENDNIKEILAKHLVSPVRFDKAIKKMMDEGVTRFIEVGPGKALTNFIKKEEKDREVELLAVGNEKALSEI